MSDHQSQSASEERKVIGFVGGYDAFPDERLVDLVRSGEKPAFEILMKRYMPVVMAFLWGKMWERDEIADVGQEVFIRAYTKLDQLRDGTKFNQWIVKIARHTWVDHCRNPETQKRKQQSSLEVVERDKGQEPVGPGADPAQTVSEGELQELVAKAIGELKERYRLIMYLRLIDEKSNSEIADLTGLKEDAVRTRFSRGLKALRKSLIAKGIEPF